MHKIRTGLTFIGFIILIISSVYYSGIGDEIKRNQISNENDMEEIEPIKIRNINDSKFNTSSVTPPYSEHKSGNFINTVNEETNISSELNETKIDEKEEIIEEKVVEVEEINSQYVGTFSITAYTWTGNAMANGEYPYYGSVASCDFPLGTVLYIEGVGNFVVNDVCPTSGVIDVYMNNYEECISFGRRYCNVYIM